MYETNLWVVLDEETLQIWTDENGPRKFKTEEEANFIASAYLGVWMAVEVHFVHPFVHHKI